MDETGAILFAFEAAWRELGDVDLDACLWRSASRGGDVLLSFCDPATGLLRPSVDLWEERWGTHAYSTAAVSAGLEAAAAMAERHGDAARRAAFADASKALARSLDSHFWDEREGCYRSTLECDDREAAPGLLYPGGLAESVELARGSAGGLGRIDASLLGLAWPFGAVAPSSRRTRRTAAAVGSRLRFPDGGIGRYDGDTYAGGNPWILTTLWLALYQRQLGETAEYERGLDYVASRQTPLGLLPEQAALDGSPAWVVPLTWSHAMLTLASRPELRIVRDFAA